MPPSVSVVVPIYNCERYLPECLDSLLGQTLEDIEIICVDDGSTDRTPEILRAYARRDARIKVLRQENAGAGVARNAGLDRATGAYLFFCDPDDWCDRNLLKSCFDKIKAHDADVLVTSLTKVDGISRTVLSRMKLPSAFVGEQAGKCFSWKEIADDLLTVGGNGPCNKLFRRSVATDNALRFQPLRRTNDLFFVKTFLASADKIAFVNEAGYCYRLRSDSATHKDELSSCFCTACESLHDWLIKAGRLDPLAGSFGRLLLGSFLFNLRSIRDSAFLPRWYADIRPRVLGMLPQGDWRTDKKTPTQLQNLIKALESGEDVGAVAPFRAAGAGAKTKVEKTQDEGPEKRMDALALKIASRDVKRQRLQGRVDALSCTVSELRNSFAYNALADFIQEFVGTESSEA